MAYVKPRSGLGTGPPKFTDLGRGQRAEAAVQQVMTEARAMLENPKVPVPEAALGFVMRQAPQHSSEGRVLGQLSNNMGQEFEDAEEGKIISPKVTPQQLKVLQDHAPWLIPTEVEAAANALLKEEMPDPAMPENIRRVQKWLAIGSAGGSTRGLGASTPVGGSPAIQPFVSVKATLYSLAEERVKNAQLEADRARQSMQLHLEEGSVLKAAYDAAEEGHRTARGELTNLCKFLKENYPGWSDAFGKKEVQDWLAAIAKGAKDAEDRKMADQYARDYRQACTAVAKADAVITECKQAWLAYFNDSPAVYSQLQAEGLAAGEALLQAKAALYKSQESAAALEESIAALTVQPAAAKEEGLHKQLYGAKAAALQRRAVQANGASELVCFLPIKKLLLLFGLIVGVPSSKREVQEGVCIRQGVGLGVPANETVAAYVARWFRNARKAKMSGIYADLRLGLVHGLANAAVRRYAEIQLVGDSQGKFQQESAMVELLESTALSYEVLEEHRRQHSGARRADHGVNVAEEQGVSSSSYRTTRTAMPGSQPGRGGAGRGGYQPGRGQGQQAQGAAANGRSGQQGPWSNWQQGRAKCSRCDRWHDEAQECWPVCAVCNRRHKKGAACRPECKTCGKRHDPSYCRVEAADRRKGGNSGNDGQRQAHVVEVQESWEDEWGSPEHLHWPGDPDSAEEADSAEEEGCYHVVDFDMPNPSCCGKTCCRVLTDSQATVERDTLPGVHIADRTMGGPLPAGFPVKMVTRSTGRAVAARVLEAEDSSTKEVSKGSCKATDKAGSKGEAAASTSKQSTVRKPKASASSSKGTTQQPHTIVVLKDSTDQELLEQLVNGSGECGLSVMLVPGKVLRAEVIKGVVDIKPAVAVSAAVAECLVEQQDEVFSCQMLNSRPMLPYIGPGACTFRHGKHKLFELRKVLIDSGASGGVLALHAVKDCGLPMETDSRQLGSAGGVIRTAGRVKDLLMELKFAAGETVSLRFDGIVLGGQQSSYDAILGRKQMHQLGMVLDFYRQQCWVRPWLVKGNTEVRMLPMTCVAPNGGAARDSRRLEEVNMLLDGVMEQGSGAQPAKAPISKATHAGYLQQKLMLSGDVEENPGPWLGPGRWQKYHDILLMIVCAVVLMVLAGEQVGAAAAGSWWRCLLSGLMGVYIVKVMLPIAEKWSYMQYLPEWNGQCRLSARKQRQYRKAKQKQHDRERMIGWDSRTGQRLRRIWLLPSVMFPVLLLLGAVMVMGVQVAHSMPLVTDFTAGCLTHGLRGWNAEAAMRSVLTSAQWRNFHDVELAGAAVLGPGEGCFVTEVTADKSPAELMQSLDPTGEKDEPEGAAGTHKDSSGEFMFANNQDVSEDTERLLQEAVRSRRRSFAFSMKELPGYKEKVSWRLKTDKPIRVPCHARKFSPIEYEIMDTKVRELEEAGMVVEVEATSAYAAMPVIAAKKNVITHEWSDHRFCINYIPLNKQMITHNYAAPLPEHIFERAAGCTVFSTVDLRAGFHQLIPTEECQEHLCFWHRRRLMKYTRLPFGIKNALPLFQQVIDKVLLEGGCSAFAAAYVDDILIMSKSPEDHVGHVGKVLDCLFEAGLRAHPSKSCFGSAQLEFIGHMLGKNGTISPLQAKVAAIQALPEPQNVPQLQHVMGIVNYYRCYIPDASAIAAPINQLTKKDAVWSWGKGQSAAFKQLKEALMREPVLRQPEVDKPFVLHTDWSTTGIGAVLAQIDDQGREYMVACTSRSLNVHEKRYTPWKGELLAVVYGVKTFRHYLQGRHFTLVTDHRPLLGLLTTAEPNCQQSRWLMALQEHDFTVHHRPGVQHINADVLSRWPRHTEADASGARMDTGPVVTPALPDVVVDGVLRSGEEQVQQLGQDLAHKFAQQWSRPKNAQPDTPTAVTGGASLDTIDVVAPDTAYFLEELECGLEEIDLPSALQQEDWELNQVVCQSVQAARQMGLPSHGTMAGGGEIDTASCAASFFPWAFKRGVVVFEPFGGLGAGLEMVLRQGFVVNRYLYADISNTARRVMAHRLLVLQQRYPGQLSSGACADAFEGPQDVYCYSSSALVKMMRPNEQWLLVAGWECQDLSAAGGGAGLAGKRSRSYYKLVDVLRWLQAAAKEVGNPAVGYVVENTAFQFNWKHQQVSKKDFETVNFTLGQPVTIDAARFGSRAHRLRNFWTNLVEPEKLAAAVECAVRPEGRAVQDILEEGRQPAPVTTADRSPLYRCNTEGEPRQAWPTLMAYQGSYNFRQNKPGAVWDEGQQQQTEPSALERERAMGYHDADTAAPGVSEEERRAVLGRCMDANATQALLGIAKEWWAQRQPEVECYCLQEVRDLNLQVLMTAAVAWWGQQQPTVNWQGVPAAEEPWELAVESGIACCIAVASSGYEGLPEDVVCVLDDDAAGILGEGEVYEDEGLLHYLEHQEMPEGLSAKEKDRIQHRARRFSLANGVLKRRMADGRMCVVPRPDERYQLVQETHNRCGHFGVRRLMTQLLHGYWWRGMKAVVKEVTSNCSLCDRSRVSFAGINPKLQSLPVQGMFYRWHVDLATKLPESARGNTCVMIMIDAFSKLVEVYPIKEKSPEWTCRGMHELIGRYGAPAQVVTDRGPEFQGEFADLLVQYMIDHTPTTAGNPQGNGQAERAVQVVKRSLKKMCEASQAVQEWEKYLPDLVLGYNCGIQQSTGYAPYTLVYGVPPVIPAARRERLSQPTLVDDLEAAAQDLVERAAIMSNNAAMAANNLLIAQRRDQLTYARKRDGTYLPKLKVFSKGDYVYVRTAADCVAGSGLTIAVEPRVLRVVQARDNGTVEVEGRDGGRRILNARNLTLCHHPGIDGEIDWSLARPAEDFPCSVCNSTAHWAEMLLCDGCGLGYHLWCHSPALSAVPAGSFICAGCKSKGVTVEAVDRRQLNTQQQQQAREEYRQFKAKANPTAMQKRRDLANAALNGRLVKRTVGRAEHWGQITFKGVGMQPPFIVMYDDGSVEECSSRHVAKRKDWLQPAGASLPAGVQIPGADVVHLVAEVPNMGTCSPEEGTVTAHMVAALLEKLQLDGGLSVAGSFSVEAFCEVLGCQLADTALEADVVLTAIAQPTEAHLATLLAQGKQAAGVLLPEGWWLEVSCGDMLPGWLEQWISQGLVWSWPAGKEGFIWVICFSSLAAANVLVRV